MSGSKADVFEQSVLNVMRGITITAPTSFQLRLYSVDETDLGSGGAPTAGTELGSTGNYGPLSLGANPTALQALWSAPQPIHDNTPVTTPSQLYAAGTQANGTQTAATGQWIGNVSTINFPASTAAYSATANAWAITDTTNVIYYHGTLSTPQTVNAANGVISFPPYTLLITED